MNRHRRLPAPATALIFIAAGMGRADAAFTVVAPTATTAGSLHITTAPEPASALLPGLPGLGMLALRARR
jgi:hypothetical protein